MNDHMARAAMAEQHRGRLLAEARQARLARAARTDGWFRQLATKVSSTWRSRSASTTAGRADCAREANLSA
jgi:hypothetical protein